MSNRTSDSSPAASSGPSSDDSHQRAAGGNTRGKNADRNGRRKRWLIQLATVFLLLGAGYSVYWWFFGRFTETTDDAYVAGNIVDVTPQIAGTVTAISADETDLVEQGQSLVELDDTDTSIALEQAKANLAETVRRIRQMFEHLDQLRENVALRKTDVAKAKEDYTRRRALIAAHAVSQEELQHARNAYETAQAALRAARYELAAVAALAGNTDIEHHPLVEAAKAKLREAYVEWERHRVPAPVTGYVAKRSVQIGQRVSPGVPLMTIVPLSQLWVEANFKEDRLADIRIGQPVRMTADVYGGSVIYHGKVVGVGAGTGGVFALLPPQNASGNWIKIVQRVPVRVSLDPHEIAKNPLRIGLSMKIAVDTHDRGGAMLAGTPVREVRYSTSVYDNESAQVDALVRAIVDGNSGKLTGIVAKP